MGKMSPSKISCWISCTSWMMSRRGECSAATVFIEMKLFLASFTKIACILKTDDSTVGEYRKLKMKPFRPTARQTLRSYYQVPLDILEDAERLCEWAARAISCQEKSSSSTRRNKS